MARLAVVLVLSCAALGAAEPLAMPAWLAPVAAVHDQTVASSATEGTATYTAPASSASVIAHYQQQMRDAGVKFETKGDGIGVSILASEDKISAVVRIRDDDGSAKVKVSYALKPEPAPQLLTVAPAAQVGPMQAQPQATAGPRNPTTPFNRSRYTWTMQSSILPGTKPHRYAAYYFEAPTWSTIEKPFATATGVVIVDVFPDDCEFRFESAAGQSITYKDAKEAIGKSLPPGTWSVFPVKCNGIDVFLK